MLRYSRSHWLLIIGLLISLEFTCRESPAEDPTSVGLKFKLSQPDAWNHTGVTIEDALSRIGRLHRLDIELDHAAIRQSGISLGLRVQTLKSPSTTVADSLTCILEPLDLQWRARGDQILVTVQNLERRKKQEIGAAPSLQKKLSGIISYDFTDKSLEQVIDSLSEQHKVQIFVDSNALKETDLSLETELSGKGLSTLRNVLNAVLPAAGLTWLAKGDRILISVKKAGI